jgi:hypothetical protein
MREKSIVAQPANSAHYSHRESDRISGLDLALVAAIGISTSIAIAVLIYAYRSKRQQESFPPKQSQAICDRCEYFNDNHFLKCAIHPATVLTEESADCLDYRLKIKAKRLGKLQRVLLSIQKVFF